MEIGNSFFSAIRLKINELLSVYHSNDTQAFSLDFNCSKHIWHGLDVPHISDKQRNHSQHSMKQKNEDTLNLRHFFFVFSCGNNAEKNIHTEEKCFSRTRSVSVDSILVDGISFALFYEQSNTRTRAYENNNSHFRYIKFMVVFVIIEGWMSVNGCWQMPLFLLAFSFSCSQFAIRHTSTAIERKE